jgi:hypothetical protein
MSGKGDVAYVYVLTKILRIKRKKKVMSLEASEGAG